MPTNWIDDPITTSTSIKAGHINQLRSVLDDLRSIFSLEQVNWTNNPVIAGNTPILATHIAEITNSIQDLWFRAGLGPLPSWSASTPPLRGTPIRASHINDLRAWIDYFEAAPNLPDPQGIVSKLYNAETDTIVNSAWVDDVTTLKTSDVILLVRAAIESTESTNDISSYHIIRFGTAVQAYQDKGHPVVGVLTGNFDRYDMIAPNDSDRKRAYCPNHALGLNGDPLLNRYIQHYASRAGAFASAMQSYGLTTFWLWNEPQRD